MANYLKATDFAAKDALLTGDPNKIVKGTEHNDEFNAIQTAVNSKSNLESPTFTGAPKAPTAALNTVTTQLATTAFVSNAIDAIVSDTGSLGLQSADNVAISGGTITGITDITVADGGTGASTATNARTNLGLAIGTNIPSPTGTGASGTWGISITGNAATASSVSTAVVNTASAASSFGGVGTYAWLGHSSSSAIGAGSTIAGSSLFVQSSSVTGTWRAMGYITAAPSPDPAVQYSYGLWLRIS
jgi:hypothetical protein